MPKNLSNHCVGSKILVDVFGGKTIITKTKEKTIQLK
jgi:hypothetical protein